MTESPPPETPKAVCPECGHALHWHDVRRHDLLQHSPDGIWFRVEFACTACGHTFEEVQEY